MKQAARDDLTVNPEMSWRHVNQAYLDRALERLRLLLQRRVLWLRSRWQHDPLQNYQAFVISEEQADWLLAGEDRADQYGFYESDTEAAKLSRAIKQLDESLDRTRCELREAGTPPPALEALVRLFDLTLFERETVLLCLAPELDPAFERLYAYVQDDIQRKYATPHLAYCLFGGAGQALQNARDRLAPGAPLRRFHLVHLDPPPTPTVASLSCPLRLDTRMVDYLRGLNRFDERLTGLLRPADPAILAPVHQDLVDGLADSKHGRVGKPTTPLNLVGPSGAGKRAVARALCDKLGLALYHLDIKQLSLPASELRDLLCLLERDLVLTQSVLYLDGTEAGAADPSVRGATRELIDRLSAFFILGSEDRWPTERQIAVVPIARPDAAAQRALWQRALVGLPNRVNGQINALVEQFDLGSTAMVQVVAMAKNQSSGTNGQGSEVTADDLWQACRVVAGKGLDDLAQRITPCYTWDDIVLPEDVRRQLREIASQVAHRFHVYETWGFGAKLSRGRGLSVLFAGSSGTGKTMAAEVLANHLQLDLYRIDLAGVVNKYIGETEKNLRKVFDAAEQAGAILFFDEADALFGKRTEVKDSHDRYANIEVNYLLQRMENYRGLAILATNRKSALDRAFLRRLRFLVDFPVPDMADRCRIWEKVFPPETKLHELDYDRLARLEITGGNIRNIALNAAFLAAEDGHGVAMHHLGQAAKREYSKIDKMIRDVDMGPLLKHTEPSTQSAGDEVSPDTPQRTQGWKG